ncbi:MAG: hypothetical protein HQ596_03025 [Candidatus Saganbacteria bacterium]|nr:hypothetical protein [Candidatus Saganbacteria bacterium]
MINLNCPVCETKIELPDLTEAGHRLNCLNCFAELAFYKWKGKNVLGCALCKEPVFEPQNCENCERRLEKKRLLEEGRL